MYSEKLDVHRFPCEQFIKIHELPHYVEPEKNQRFRTNYD